MLGTCAGGTVESLDVYQILHTRTGLRGNIVTDLFEKILPLLGARLLRRRDDKSYVCKDPIDNASRSGKKTAHTIT